MIVIAKEDLKLHDMKIALKGYKWNFPVKRMHHPGTIVFARGKSYNIRLNGDSYHVKTEAGNLFFFNPTGPGIPEGLFRIFTS